MNYLEEVHKTSKGSDETQEFGKSFGEDAVELISGTLMGIFAPLILLPLLFWITGTDFTFGKYILLWLSLGGIKLLLCAVLIGHPFLVLIIGIDRRFMLIVLLTLNYLAIPLATIWLTFVTYNHFVDLSNFASIALYLFYGITALKTVFAYITILFIVKD